MPALLSSWSRLAPVAALLALTACGGGGSPVDRPVGQNRIVRQVGPGGAVIRGDGGSPLEGFLLEIPAGALGRLVEITVEAGADIALPESAAMSAAFAIRARPDPGVLLVPAVLEVGLALPQSRRPEDLFVASRAPAERPSAIATPSARLGVAADAGGYDPGTRVFAAAIRRLGDVQVRAADRPRLTADAFGLLQLGYASLARLTEAGLLEADLLFGQSQRADPFAGPPNLFRALTRVLVVLNDRADTGPGLDSVGEALERYGIALGGASLIDRFRLRSWPTHVVVPPDAPRTSEILEMLRVRLRPAIDLALQDLDRVPATITVDVTLPSAFPSLPGDRQLDATDVVALRAVLGAAAFAIDHLPDYELDFDPALAFPRGAPQPSLQELLALHPALGRLVRAPDPGTVMTLRAAMLHVREAYEALLGEDDDQSDDLVTFADTFDEAQRGRWRQNLVALHEAIEADVVTRLTIAAGVGSVAIRLREPWSTGAISPRALAPELFRFVPLAGTLPDPTFAGALPATTQDRATDLLGLADVHDTPRLGIVADGSFADWSVAADALSPADPIGDVGEPALRGIDLWQVGFAENDDELAFRIGVADGDVGPQPGQTTSWGLVVREVTAGGFGPPIEVTVSVGSGGHVVAVTRDGIPRAVRAAAAGTGSDLEVVLNRFDLLDPDEPVTDRAVWAFAAGEMLTEAEIRGSDRTRPFLVRF